MLNVEKVFSYHSFTQVTSFESSLNEAPLVVVVINNEFVSHEFVAGDFIFHNYGTVPDLIN